VPTRSSSNSTLLAWKDGPQYPEVGFWIWCLASKLDRSNRKTKVQGAGDRPLLGKGTLSFSGTFTVFLRAANPLCLRWFAQSRHIESDEISRDRGEALRRLLLASVYTMQLLQPYHIRILTECFYSFLGPLTRFRRGLVAGTNRSVQPPNRLGVIGYAVGPGVY